MGTTLYHVTWVGFPEEANTWEPYENIEDDELINDYEGRQCEAEEQEAAEAEALRDLPAEEEVAVTVVEDEVAPTPAAPTVVEAAAAVEMVPVKVVNHHHYRLKVGGLACWWVQLQYRDGSKTNGFVSPLPLAESKVGRDVLKAYAATKKGAKMAKVVNF